MNIQKGVKTGAGHFEIEREGRRVLRRLTDRQLFLAPQAGSHFALTGSHRAGRSMRVSANVMEQFLNKGWLQPRGTSPETFRISPAGARWFAQNKIVDPFVPSRAHLRPRLVDTPEGKQLAIVNEAESPLTRLRYRGQVTAIQYEAGNRLRRDFTIAGLMPRLCANLAAPVSTSAPGTREAPLTEKMIAAKQRFRLAMTFVGPGLSDVLIDVCCFLKGLEAVEGLNAWPTRSAKVVLNIALDRLAAHYGYSIPPIRRRPRTWHAPQISASA